MFGFFLNTFLWLFDLSLPKIKKTSTIIQNNGWITPTIKVLCCLKRDLYQHIKNYNDPKLKNYYKVRCKILSNMIKETKRSYNRQIVISKNKMKTTWNIVEVVRVRKFVHKNIHILNTDCNLTNKQQTISNSLNDHILSTSDRVNNKTFKNLNPNTNNSIPMEYLLKTFKNLFPNIKYNYTSKKEIENIINS